MKWMKYGIPVLLGIGAFVGNWMVLHNLQGQDAATIKLVRVKSTMKAGSKIDKDNLEEISFQGRPDDLKQLSRAAVQSGEANVIAGQVALRDLKSNDLVFWKDVGPTPTDLGSPALHLSLDSIDVNVSMLNVGDELLFLVPKRPEVKFKKIDKTDKIELPQPLPNSAANFDQLGPFRILSVGENVARQIGDVKDKSSSGQRMITLAVDFDQSKKHLEDNDQVLKLVAALESSDNSSKKVKAVQIPKYIRDAKK